MRTLYFSPMAELEATIDGDEVVALKNWASVWADLLHVDMVLHAREAIPEHPANLFTRRALWEGAVIAYGRTAKAGRREVLISEVLQALGDDSKRIHQDVLRWRDKHNCASPRREARNRICPPHHR
jgi:hypothetical protein